MKRLLAALLILAVLAPAANAGLREDNIQRWVNSYRQRHGQGWLFRSWPLDAISEHHSQQMGGNERFVPLRLNARYGYVLAGARPGRLYGDAFLAWVHSDKRRILLGSWDRFGIGVVEMGGRLWTTVLFR